VSPAVLPDRERFLPGCVSEYDKQLGVCRPSRGNDLSLLSCRLEQGIGALAASNLRERRLERALSRHHGVRNRTLLRAGRP